MAYYYVQVSVILLLVKSNNDSIVFNNEIKNATITESLLNTSPSFNLVAVILFIVGLVIFVIIIYTYVCRKQTRRVVDAGVAFIINDRMTASETPSVIRLSLRESNVIPFDIENQTVNDHENHGNNNKIRYPKKITTIFNSQFGNSIDDEKENERESSTISNSSTTSSNPFVERMESVIDDINIIVEGERVSDIDLFDTPPVRAVHIPPYQNENLPTVPLMMLLQQTVDETTMSDIPPVRGEYFITN